MRRHRQRLGRRQRPRRLRRRCRCRPAKGSLIFQFLFHVAHKTYAN